MPPARNHEVLRVHDIYAGKVRLYLCTYEQCVNMH